jgi:CubicO group peptidase (beta-lactamase class C family)
MRTSYAVLVIVSFLFSTIIVNAQYKWPTKEWTVVTPQSQSMNADSLRAFDNDITGGKYGNVDGMMITRHGKLIYRKDYKHDYNKIYGDSANKKSALNALDPGGQYNYFNPWWHPFYRREELHTLQSVTKTITSVIIGVAVARSEFPDLSTPVLTFFDTAQVKNIDERKRRMTIRHLLTMSAGFDWNEEIDYNDPRNDCSVMEASFDWIQYVIDKPMADEPGSVFNYNSGASELLAYIFRKATGKDIEEYAAAYLFAPLGITNYFWKRIPTGLADTEGGLYLNIDDLAKIAYLFLREGNWNGKQIVTKEWVKASVTPQIAHYGYKWWLYNYNGMQAWHGSGFGGQFPIIIPEYDIVVVHGTGFLGPGEAIRRIVNAVEDKK